MAKEETLPLVTFTTVQKFGDMGGYLYQITRLRMDPLTSSLLKEKKFLLKVKHFLFPE